MTDYLTSKLANLKLNNSFRRADRRVFLPDSFVLSENASNEYIFIIISGEESILNKYLFLFLIIILSVVL